ncbi:MAG: hypothetical protein QW478_04705 [Candidatus Micrarchaeaceae archaeon]
MATNDLYKVSDAQQLINFAKELGATIVNLEKTNKDLTKDVHKLKRLYKKLINIINQLDYWD